LKKALSIVFLGAVLLSAAALNAQDVPLSIKLEGGVPQVINCQSNEIPVLSWSFGGSVPTSTSGGTTGTTSGKATLSQLTIAKAFDGCSAGLFQALVRGAQYTKVTLTQLKKDDKGLLNPFMSVVMTKAMITSYQISGSSGDTAFESESFNFVTITIRNAENGSSFCWNTAKQAPC